MPVLVMPKMALTSIRRLDETEVYEPSATDIRDQHCLHDHVKSVIPAVASGRQTSFPGSSSINFLSGRGFESGSLPVILTASRGQERQHFITIFITLMMVSFFSTAYHLRRLQIIEAIILLLRNQTLRWHNTISILFPTTSTLHHFILPCPHQT